jgi:hypothetical protein
MEPENEFRPHAPALRNQRRKTLLLQFRNGRLSVGNPDGKLLNHTPAYFPRQLFTGLTA